MFSLRIKLNRKPNRRCLQQIHAQIEAHAQMNNVGGFIHQVEISKDIERCHHMITECLAAFQVCMIFKQKRAGRLLILELECGTASHLPGRPTYLKRTLSGLTPSLHQCRGHHSRHCQFELAVKLFKSAMMSSLEFHMCGQIWLPSVEHMVDHQQVFQSAHITEPKINRISRTHFELVNQGLFKPKQLFKKLI